MLDHQHNYNLKRWKDGRKRQLFEQPRCVMCLAMNRQTPATVVDHIIPHCGDDKLFWDRDNWQSLCDKCHNQKTWYESYKSPYLPKTIRPKSKDITLLFGPPGSGRHKWADAQEATVISIERIKESIGHQPHKLPTCIAVRNNLIEKCKNSVIIIEELPNPRHRADWVKKLGAKPVYMITAQHMCKADKHKVKRWFDEFKPSGCEGFVSG